MSYQEFLDSKKTRAMAAGIELNPATLSPALYDFQREIVHWALRLGRAAIFADCGLGKTLMQLAWAEKVPGDVLILAPLAVAQQTVREGERFGIEVNYCRDASQVKPGITITNYEMLEKFDASRFAGIVLDESSILKAFDGKTRNLIIDSFADTRFKLACTATPAPNDFMELGNHAQFLNVMSYTEMLAMFFVHDGGDTSQWRLKGHAEKLFWSWVCSWAVNIRKPSDLGYADEGFSLPPLTFEKSVVTTSSPMAGYLIPMMASTLPERIKARRETVDGRASRAAQIVNAEPNEQWLIWCNLNAEAEAVKQLIPGAVEIRGSDKLEKKRERMLAFSDGTIRVLVSKPSICGFGMNWQNCSRVVFLGLSDSYEALYQAVRRCWRYGQTHEVFAHIVTADIEGEVLRNVQRKEADHQKLSEQMVNIMRDEMNKQVHGVLDPVDMDIVENEVSADKWTMRQGDCVDLIKALPDNSVHFSVFSPPFASLYTYTDSEADMGNCKDNDTFMEHFDFLIKELHRVIMPGRLVSFHCMNLPSSKTRDGVIGLKDFRGDLIRAFQKAGFIYHSEVVIWKDPVIAMQRTKALGLLHKQIKKDSCMSRQGVPDYLVTMRKPGVNSEPVSHTGETFPVGVWQQYASPVWMDINPSDTLQYRSAREDKDEKHICPLQLTVIRRALELWSNPGDTVLSPFAGIGSEGFQAVKMGRKFIGFELKGSYYRQAVGNLKAVVNEARDLFSIVGQDYQAEAVA